MLSSRVRRIAPLLFVSGFCALTEQVVWERELRLVFGITTAASAAVIAIFIGGLGFGSLWLGKRADRHPTPLRLYGHLELGVALLVALSPFLIAAIRKTYILTGGSERLGTTGGTLLRLTLAAVVLGPPTLLMGGTLPAAVRAVEYDKDTRRSVAGRLYGMNTLGAVIGAFVTTLWWVESFGNRVTLWMASLLVALVGLAARALSRTQSFVVRDNVADQQEPSSSEPLPETTAGSSSIASSDASTRVESPDRPRFQPLVIVSAGLFGVAFFVMELVAPRMLAPLLGGTVFTFGLVVAVALLGIAVGGLWYGLSSPPPTLLALAGTCALEALAFAVPLALGDRIALLTIRLRPLTDFGFSGYGAVAVLISSIVLLPAAIVSGYQFPLLIALLGRGRDQVGRDIGRAFAANSLGAMLGALAGGFVLIPRLTAPGSWRLVICLLLILAVALAASHVRQQGWRSFRLLGLCLLAGATAILATSATGPTAVWRHSGIGAGRAAIQAYSGPNQERKELNRLRASLLEEHDGRESSMAMMSEDAVVLVIGGKADASTRYDVATQVGTGLLGALRHPRPRHALVVGLATGCTAGWLGANPEVERVDVMELEPATVAMARLAGPLNERVLDNPKVHLRFADAREYLLTTRQQFDVIASEPSNPYRAGVAALYTSEFYQAVARHLEPNGIFLQWVQAYDVDSSALRTVFATLASIFDHAEVWELSEGDLVVVASRQTIGWDITQLRRRVAEPVMRRGLQVALGVDSLEGLLSRFLGRDGLLGAVVGEQAVINTDDQNYLEFSFARMLGRPGLPLAAELAGFSRASLLESPQVPAGSVDWVTVGEEMSSAAVFGDAIPTDPRLRGEARTRAVAKASYAAGNCSSAWSAWRSQTLLPRSPAEHLLAAECATAVSAGEAEALRQGLAAVRPTEAALLDALVRCRESQPTVCAPSMESAIARLRDDPWVHLGLARRALTVFRRMAMARQPIAEALTRAIAVPFSVRNLETTRRDIHAEAATRSGSPDCRAAFEQLEPNPRWEPRMLELRLSCYKRTDSPFVKQAAADLEQFAAAEDRGFAAPAARDAAGP
jgi:spermidine synthase